MNGEGVDWPAPSFHAPGALYTCARCGDVVVPESGDKEAGLVIAGATIKVCADCADRIRDEIDGFDPSEEGEEQ